MNKTIYIRQPELWERAATSAATREISVSALIERAIEAYLRPTVPQRADVQTLLKRLVN